jgi:tetratricopeptide (TPR) repeat protein
MFKHISQSILFAMTAFLLCGFFWEGDEKDLGVLCAKAKKSLDAHEFQAAADEYQAILRRFDVHKGGKNALGWQSYIDCCLNLVIAWTELEEWEKAEAQMLSLEGKAPPPEYLPRIRLVQARVESKNKDPANAFIKLAEVIESFPQVKWNPQETAFYCALRYALDQEYEDLLRKGKRLAKAGFHKEALPLFESVLEAAKKGAFPRARGSTLLEKYLLYLIAESHYALADYESSLNYLSIDFEEERLDNEMLFLSALCHKEKENYEKAVDCFKTYLDKGKQTNYEHYIQALFELGLYAFNEKNYTKALPYLNELVSYLKQNSRLAQYGALYLAKTHISLNQYDDGERILNIFEKTLSKKSTLHAEIAYLRGEIAFHKQAFFEAAFYFKRSLNEKQNGAFRQKALYHLSLCLFKQSTSSRFSFDEKMKLLEEAENGFLSLIRTPLEEQAITALTSTYLKHHELYKSNKLHEKAVNLLRKEGKSHALKVLLAEVTKESEEREQIIEALLADQAASPLIKARAWQIKGSVAYESGNLLDAILAFETALTFSKELEVGLIHQLCEKESDCFLSKLYSSLKKDASDKLSHQQLYVLGLLAFSTSKPANETISIFEKLIEQFPSSPYKDSAFLMTSKVLIQEGKKERAKQLLSHLTSHCTSSSYLPEAHYLLLKILKEEQGPTASLQKKMMEFVELCPFSPFAPLAYFEFFSFDDYLEGSCESLNHLLAFESLFPNSPLNVVTHSLLGQNAGNIDKKLWHWEKAFYFYENEKSKGMICPYENQAILSQISSAQLWLQEKNDPEKARVILERLSKNNADSKPLNRKISLLQAECSKRLGQLAIAQKKINDLIKLFKKEGISQDPILSKAWELQGDLACTQDFCCALKNYECACSTLLEADHNTERSVQLRLKMSQCYTQMGLLDQSMRCLSYVINADVASPFRIEAMVRRAEIYALQQRPELAIRQLESAAKFGGEWGEKAKLLLRESYGLECR